MVTVWNKLDLAPNPDILQQVAATEEMLVEGRFLVLSDSSRDVLQEPAGRSLPGYLRLDLHRQLEISRGESIVSTTVQDEFASARTFVTLWRELQPQEKRRSRWNRTHGYKGGHQCMAKFERLHCGLVLLLFVILERSPQTLFSWHDSAGAGIQRLNQPSFVASLAALLLSSRADCMR